MTLKATSCPFGSSENLDSILPTKATQVLSSLSTPIEHYDSDVEISQQILANNNLETIQHATTIATSTTTTTINTPMSTTKSRKKKRRISKATKKMKRLSNSFNTEIEDEYNLNNYRDENENPIDQDADNDQDGKDEDEDLDLDLENENEIESDNNQEQEQGQGIENEIQIETEIKKETDVEIQIQNINNHLTIGRVQEIEIQIENVQEKKVIKNNQEQGSIQIKVEDTQRHDIYQHLQNSINHEKKLKAVGQVPLLQLRKQPITNGIIGFHLPSKDNLPTPPFLSRSPFGFGLDIDIPTQTDPQLNNSYQLFPSTPSSSSSSSPTPLSYFQPKEINLKPMPETKNSFSFFEVGDSKVQSV